MALTLHYTPPNMTLFCESLEIFLTRRLVDNGLEDHHELSIDGRFAAVSNESWQWLLQSGDGGLLSHDGFMVASMGTSTFEEPQGEVRHLQENESIQLDNAWAAAELETILIREQLQRLGRLGVVLHHPERIWLAPTVTIEPTATIWPGVTLLGNTHIGAGATVEANCWLADTQVQANATVKVGTVSTDAIIESGANVGPMAHLRTGASLGPRVKVGNFVEVKKTRLEEGAKASHLTYLGDAIVGKHANIGAGTITCNYDGYGKHKTVIGERAFIGSNSSLIAPVTIGAGSIIGAGGTVTKDVAPDTLHVERADERVFEGRASGINKRNAAKAGKDYIG